MALTYPLCLVDTVNCTPCITGQGASAVSTGLCNVIIDNTPHTTSSSTGVIPGGIGTQFGATDSYRTIDIGRDLISLTNDTYNSIATNVNTTVTTIACTINQIVEYLKCLGPGTCVLTGPKPCCPPVDCNGNPVGPIPQPATVSFALPNILTGMGTCPVITSPLLQPGPVITPAYSATNKL